MLNNYFDQSSERLTYRKIVESDIDTWVHFFEDNPSLHFLGVDTSLSNLTLTTDWINKQFFRYENEGFGHLAVIEKCTGLHIGMAGILEREIEGKRHFEIAYSLLPNSWGKGYGTEIALNLKKYGLENKISEKFISIIHKDNIASQKIAQKNGMKIISEINFMGIDAFLFETEL